MLETAKERNAYKKAKNEYARDTSLMKEDAFAEKYGQQKGSSFEDYSKKQNSLNEVNTNDIAYIKGLLYALVNRVGKLETVRKEDISTSKAQADESASSKGTGSSANQTEDGSQNKDTASTSGTQCNVRATFNCDDGTWSKGSFYTGCSENAENNGYVHSGKTVTYTKVAQDVNCAISGADSNCNLAVWGQFYMDEVPDSMLADVQRNYPCETDESSEEPPQPSNTLKYSITNTVCPATWSGTKSFGTLEYGCNASWGGDCDSWIMFGGYSDRIDLNLSFGNGCIQGSPKRVVMDGGGTKYISEGSGIWNGTIYNSDYSVILGTITVIYTLKL